MLSVYSKFVMVKTVRTPMVDITIKDLESLKRFEPFPYKGNSNRDLLIHLKEFMKIIDSNIILPDDCPEVIHRMWVYLMDTDEKSEIVMSNEREDKMFILAEDNMEVHCIEGGITED